MSAASGAVGSVVGQLAKAKGCRAIGFAGGPDKCRYVIDELGFDACIDYKAHGDPKSLYAALKAVTPDGMDGHFENVGGAVLDAVLLRMNDFGRIALCGMISGYNGEPIPMQVPVADPHVTPARRRLHRQRAHGRWPAALTELGTMVATGKLKYRETIAEGPRRRAGSILRNAEGKELRKTTGEAVRAENGRGL